MITAIFVWWLTIQLLGVLALPLTQWFFRTLPDRGYAFSKAFGLLLTGYLAWLLAMLGIAPFERGPIVACALAVGALGLLVSGGRRGLAALRAWLLAHWRRVLAYEAIFLLAFLALIRMRGYDNGIMISPNPYGTERPMDYALFNAIRVSGNFPPHDPWLSGYSINYYYFGYLLMALMSLLSGIAQGTAYNLSLALIFALTALGVAGVVFSLIGLTTASQRPSTEEAPPRRTWLGRAGLLGAAALAIVLVLLAGNQGGALEIITGSHKILELGQQDFVRAVANGLGARAPLALDAPYTAWGDANLTTEISPTNTIADFNWWNPSRALWDTSPQPGDSTRYYTITEFPFFSFWLGDMHPHVMSLPFTLLALALALQTLARPAAPNYTMGWRGWADLALTGIVLGSLYLINSWDLPTYVLLYLGALLLLYVRLGAPPALADGKEAPAGPFAALGRVWWRHFANQAIVALLAAAILFVPFHLTFRSLVGGNGSPLLLVTWTRSLLHSFLVIFGLFLVPLLAYVFAQRRAAQPASLALGIARTGARPVTLALAAPWLIGGTLLVGLAIGFPLLALVPLALYAISLALENVQRPAAAFVLWAFALACLVCFGTEIVYLRDVFNSRMNTIFKFYYQVWLIWGVLAGYAVWWLLLARTENREPRTEKRTSALHRFLVPGALLLFGVLLAGALVYPWMTAGKLVREAPWVGIDGVTPREKTPDGAAAIAWLRAYVPNDKVVLEAVGGSYDNGYSGLGFGQVSGSTGLATVLGWPGHEDQWRGGDPAARAQIEPRKADVTTIYSSTDTVQAAELLQKYSVDYIYVGEAERTTYPTEGLAKLAQLGDIAFQQGDVIIYKVKK